MRCFRILAAVLAAVLGTFTVKAQNYEPKDTWPYLLPEFTSGEIYMSKGGTVTSRELNVNIIDGKLQYLENGVIMVADMLHVTGASIGGRKFENVLGRMQEIKSFGEKGSVLNDVQVDKDKMAKTDIGYGISSATASSQNVTSLLGESSTALVNMDISQAIDKRSAGSVLPVMEQLSLKIQSDILPATKKDVLSLPYVDKSAADAFFKAHKIKWKSPEMLQQVVDFIYDQKQNK